MRNVLTAVGLAAALAAGTANGAMLQYVGTSIPYTTPSNNNVMQGVVGRIGGNLNFADAGQIEWTFIGYEAGYTNTLISGSCTIGNRAPLGTRCTTAHAGGDLAWAFTVFNPWIPGMMPGVNPGNNSPTANATVFFSIINDYEFYIALDDGGAGPDDNHDDWFGRGRLIPNRVTVPETGTVALMGAMLLVGGVGLRARRTF